MTDRPHQPDRSSKTDYVLGVDAAEDARLALQHEVLAASTHALWHAAGVASGHRILDLGCGPGYAALDLASLVGPKGHVFAVDRSADYLSLLRSRAKAAGLTNITALESDAQHIAALTAIPPASLDFAYARYILTYPPRPQDAITGVFTKLKPGAKFIIQDMFNYATAPALAPRSPIFDKVTLAAAESIRHSGGDPDIAGRLPRLLLDAGFIITHLDSHQRLARPGTPLWRYRDALYRGFVPRLVSRNVITAADATEFFRVWDAAAADPAAFALTPTIVDIIAEKP